MTYFSSKNSNSSTWLEQFGGWIREIRIGNGLQLRTVAAKAGIDSSTLSRIERGLTSPTLESVVGLFKSLEVPPGHLYQTNLSKTRETEFATALTKEQLLDLAGNIMRATPTWYPVLANSLKNICEVEMPASSAYRNIFKADSIRFFVEPPGIFSCNLSYPCDIAPGNILEIYQQGGALLPEDVSTYAQQALTQQSTILSSAGENRPVPPPVQHAAQALGQSPQTVKLLTLLKLDELCQANGAITLMGWEAAEFALAGYETSPQIFGMARLCLLVLRWELHLGIETGSFTEHLHQLKQGVALLHC